MSWIVRVPSTSGNMGSGFDALGIALDVAAITVRIEKAETPLAIAEITGEGADELPRDNSNRIMVAAYRAAERVGVTKLTGRLFIDSTIPNSRGLGSSAAAAVAGALVADTLLGGKVGRAHVLNVASELEGHSDNVAPALHGGVQVSVHAGNEFLTCAVPINAPLAAAVFVPEEPLSTQRSRGVLPKTVSMHDAVHNLGHAALTVSALATGRLELLRESLKDLLHEPPRTQLMPWLPAMVSAAVDGGAYGAALSGAGTTVCAYCAPDKAASVADALSSAAKKLGLAGYAKACGIDTTGAVVQFISG